MDVSPTCLDREYALFKSNYPKVQKNQIIVNEIDENTTTNKRLSENSRRTKYLYFVGKRVLRDFEVQHYILFFRKFRSVSLFNYLKQSIILIVDTELCDGA